MLRSGAQRLLPNRTARISPSIALACLLLASGCCNVPAGQLKALAESTSQLNQVSQRAYEQSVQLERAWIVLTLKSGPMSARSFDLETAFQLPDRRKRLGDKDLGARMQANAAALAVINNYLFALSAFANKDFQSDLEAQSTKLAASVKSLDSLSEPWAKPAAVSSEYIATAIDGMGHAYIEYQRGKTLELTMNATQQALQDLANFVITNDQTAEQVLQTMERYYIEGANLLQPPHHSAEQLAFRAYVANVIGQFDDAGKTLNGIDTAMQKLPAAHDELQKSMCSDKPNIESLTALIAETERLSKFYKSVK
jgi:hypothetical protein